MRVEWRREGLAFLSGLLLVFSFPKLGHGAVAWVALTPLLVALAGARPLQAFSLGYLTGAVSAMGLVYWTAWVVVQYGGLHLGVGFLVLSALCLALALFPALFACTVALWQRAFGSTGLWLAPVAWVATEVLRAHTLFRFAWCLLGYSQQRNVPIIQIAAYTAVYGVSFLVAGVAATLAYAVVERRAWPRRRALLITAWSVSSLWIWGAWTASRPIHESGRIRVGLVQASILQQEKWDSEKAWGNVERHVQLTELATRRGARLVVWPESAVAVPYDADPVMAARLQTLTRQRQVYLLFGNDDQDPRNERYWVGAKLLAPDGALRLRYHKIRLVPFGEYVPLQPVFTLGGRWAAKVVQQVADFAPGTEYSMATIDGHALAAFICYEAIFPDLVRQFRARGAELLVNITNDAWYGRSSAPYQHLAMAAMRAVENGVYLVRAANTGITAVVDPRGRIVEQTRLFESTVLVRDVPLVGGGTFYSRHGDVFGWACFFAAVALTLRACRRSIS